MHVHVCHGMRRGGGGVGEGIQAYYVMIISTVAHCCIL